MWNRLTGAEAPSEDVSQETSRASMEELEQKELLIQQLKDIVRSNEEILKQKEKELQENNAKFQKFKLQSKARIAQLTNQVKAHEPSPELVRVQLPALRRKHLSLFKCTQRYVKDR